MLCPPRLAVLNNGPALCRIWSLLGPLVLAGAQANSQKIAPDLRTVLAAATTPTLSWARDVNGVRYVKMLIVSNADGAELIALRAALMAAGGSIDDRYSSELALAALVPANQVGNLAARVDVQSVSPNRLMTRATSTVQAVTGTAALRTTSATNDSQITGVTGKGIGIAVLDAGIA